MPHETLLLPHKFLVSGVASTSTASGVTGQLIGPLYAKL